jgi:hypothetical protein
VINGATPNTHTGPSLASLHRSGLIDFIRPSLCGLARKKSPMLSQWGIELSVLCQSNQADFLGRVFHCKIGSKSTISSIDHLWSETPAFIAGVLRRVW